MKTDLTLVATVQAPDGDWVEATREITVDQSATVFSRLTSQRFERSSTPGEGDNDFSFAGALAPYLVGEWTYQDHLGREGTIDLQDATSFRSVGLEEVWVHAEPGSSGELLQLAEILDDGVSSDIWYDADDQRDGRAARLIAKIQAAMGKSAEVLRQQAELLKAAELRHADATAPQASEPAHLVRRPAHAPKLPFESTIITYPNGPEKSGEAYWTANAHVSNLVARLQDSPLHVRTWVIETLNAAVLLNPEHYLDPLSKSALLAKAEAFEATTRLNPTPADLEVFWDVTAQLNECLTQMEQATKMFPDDEEWQAALDDGHDISARAHKLLLQWKTQVDRTVSGKVPAPPEPPAGEAIQVGVNSGNTVLTRIMDVIKTAAEQKLLGEPDPDNGGQPYLAEDAGDVTNVLGAITEASRALLLDRDVIAYCAGETRDQVRTRAPATMTMMDSSRVKVADFHAVEVVRVAGTRNAAGALAWRPAEPGLPDKTSQPGYAVLLHSATPGVAPATYCICVDEAGRSAATAALQASEAVTSRLFAEHDKELRVMVESSSREPRLLRDFDAVEIHAMWRDEATGAMEPVDDASPDCSAYSLMLHCRTGGTETYLDFHFDPSSEADRDRARREAEQASEQLAELVMAVDPSLSHAYVHGRPAASAGAAMTM